MLKPNEIHFLGNVNQKALIKKDGKFLLVQYPKDSKKHPDPRAWEKWDMPGGRLNEGEDVLLGLKREVLEEVGLEVVIQKPLTTGTFTNLRGRKNFFVIYEATLENPEKPFMFGDEEVGDAKWFEPKEILELPILYSEYREALRKVLQL